MPANAIALAASSTRPRRVDRRTALKGIFVAAVSAAMGETPLRSRAAGQEGPRLIVPSSRNDTAPQQAGNLTILASDIVKDPNWEDFTSPNLRYHLLEGRKKSWRVQDILMSDGKKGDEFVGDVIKGVQFRIAISAVPVEKNKTLDMYKYEKLQSLDQKGIDHFLTQASILGNPAYWINGVIGDEATRDIFFIANNTLWSFEAAFSDKDDMGTFIQNNQDLARVIGTFRSP